MSLLKPSDRRVMLREINEIPSRVERQLAVHGEAYRERGAWLNREPPRFVTTCARGSSDCAALYLKYLVEMRLGIPVSSIGPSVASLYLSSLQTQGAVSFAVSQSGGSQDIAALHQSLQSGGARGIALINADDSLLGKISQHTLPIGAGSEVAVPATKSFVCSLVAIASIVAEWANDQHLASALEGLPEALAKTLSLNSDDRFGVLSNKNSAFVLSRGPSLAVAQEAALKLKETAFVHAEAFSAAEVLHGPAALVDSGFVCMIFPPQDQARDEVLETAGQLKKMGAQIITMEVEETTAAIHPLLVPLLQIIRFYVLAEEFAQKRGLNPDMSRNLRKITDTL
ncbi:SIS domain-containing protein [Hoeflea sp. G2-23]|uniref:SIS domain-containing protein n=1 Tax=Hoeflea algicola TaxID=2983763 RepID=A0ABT3Z9T0_9HYPH|nr:SIS domain-containing protein [Hoeflea algicola]MCY0148525.1 SIS domain-containing protein [Hoeflea algicola]